MVSAARSTGVEIEVSDIAKRMDNYLKGLEKVMDCKKKMVARDLTVAKANCAVCGGKDTMKLALAPQRRDKSGFHVRWSCTCGFSGME